MPARYNTYAMPSGKIAANPVKPTVSRSARAEARDRSEFKTSMWRYRLDGGAKLLQDAAGRWHLVVDGWSHAMFADICRAVDYLGCVDRDARNALYARYGRQVRQLTQLPFAEFFSASTGTHIRPATFC